MVNNQKFNNPYMLVADALDCDVDTLFPDSGWGHSPPEWDSFGHAQVILAIEHEYDIQIDDEDIYKFKTMSLILQFHNDASTRETSDHSL